MLLTLLRTGLYRWLFPRKAKAYRLVQKANLPKHFAAKLLTVPSGAVCVDCGAHAGDISAIFSALGAEVKAFEPNRDLFESLVLRFQGDSNVQLIDKAVWHKDATVTLNSLVLNGRPNIGGSSILKIDESDELQQAPLQHNVEAVDLSAFIKTLIRDRGSNIYILKLDVEGAEFETLECLIQNGLHKKIRFIFCETHARFFADGAARLERLKKVIADENATNIYLDWL